MAVAAHAKGIAGLVFSGAVRDFQEVSELNSITSKDTPSTACLSSFYNREQPLPFLKLP